MQDTRQAGPLRPKARAGWRGSKSRGVGFKWNQGGFLTKIGEKDNWCHTVLGFWLVPTRGWSVDMKKCARIGKKW